MGGRSVGYCRIHCSSLGSWLSRRVRYRPGAREEVIRTLVAVQVGVTSTLASKRETVRVERSLQSIRASGSEINRALRDMASRGRGANPHGQAITIDEGDIVVVGATRLMQRELRQGDGGNTLCVTVNHRFPI